jgi:hypothetical protein
MSKLLLYHHPHEKLIQFLYVLCRDYLTLGDIEDIVKKHTKKTNFEGCTSFSNSHLAEYVIDVAKRLGMGTHITTREV